MFNSRVISEGLIKSILVHKLIAESSDITMTSGLFLTHSAASKEDPEVFCGNPCISASSRRGNSAW